MIENGTKSGDCHETDCTAKAITLVSQVIEKEVIVQQKIANQVTSNSRVIAVQ